MDDLGLTESGYYWANDGRAWSIIWWDADYPKVAVCVGMNEPVLIYNEFGEPNFVQFVEANPPEYGPDEIEGGCDDNDGI